NDNALQESQEDVGKKPRDPDGDGGHEDADDDPDDLDPDRLLEDRARGCNEKRRGDHAEHLKNVSGGDATGAVLVWAFMFDEGVERNHEHSGAEAVERQQKDGWSHVFENGAVGLDDQS